MSKHRAGDRRIISISIPEEIALRLDKKVGKGKQGRSATISRMIEESLSPTIPTSSKKDSPSSTLESLSGEIRVESDTMGELDVPADRYYGCQTARSLINSLCCSSILTTPTPTFPRPATATFKGVLTIISFFLFYYLI